MGDGCELSLSDEEGGRHGRRWRPFCSRRWSSRRRSVRHKLNITVFIFRDGTYNMVAFQQNLQFGRTSGVEFGNPDLVRYAESLGCIGLRVESKEQLPTVMR